MRIAASILLAVAFLVARPAGGRNALDIEYEETIARLEKEAAAIPPEENAATYYRKAFLALPKGKEGGSRPISHPPKTDEEKVEHFIRRVLRRVPPDAINEMPGAKEKTRKYEEAVTVHLRRGAAMKSCSFNLDWRAGERMLLLHLGKMRNLARQAVCYGKLLELEKKPRQAAQVYLDVIRMGCHLDQDPALISVLVGIFCVVIATPAPEGLLARGVDAETARFLLDGLRALPERPFNAARAVDIERVYYGGWVRREYIKLADQDKEKFLLAMPRRHNDAEREPWKVPDTPEERRRLLHDAFEIYDAQMKQLSRAMDGPYHRTRHRVESLVRAQKTYWKGEAQAGHFAGAMVGRLVGYMDGSHARAARAEGSLGGLKLLAAACLAKAKTGEYPDSLAALKEYFPGGVPRDPFTGGNFSYWFADGLPAAACKGDDPEVKKKRPATYLFGLSYRLGLEKREVEKWRGARGEATRKAGAAE